MLKSEGYSDEAEREKSVDAIGKFPAMVSAINHVRWKRSGC
ncbi:MAG: hypothetical protein WBL95_25070 [Microcoleus sp.]